MRRALCDFVGVASSIVATVIAGFVFVGLWVMTLVSLVKSDGQVPDKPGRKNKPRRKKQKSPASAQRRASRSRKKDRAKLLTADATVTFAAERKAADVGEVFEALDNDLVGLVPMKRRCRRSPPSCWFIDGAYYLYRVGDSLDYGQEAIEILLQVMENDRDKLVVILAGYKDRMGEFFTSNPGMSSRVAHHLDFAAYELDELTAIGRLMLDQSRYYLSRMQRKRFVNTSLARWTSPVRQRAQRPQRTRACPAPPRPPPCFRPAPQLDPR